MQPLKREFAVGLLVIAVVLSVLYHCTGCLTTAQKEAIADQSYAAEHLRCVDAYDTRKEIDACREAVRIRWGIAETARKDGGR